jgi:phenol hydroxylase P2 protein
MPAPPRPVLPCKGINVSNAFIAFQKNDDSRCIVEAILEDNPGAMVVDQPSMVKIDVPNRLVIKRETVEEKMGRSFDLQELQLHLITISGHLDETDDEFTLSWNS